MAGKKTWLVITVKSQLTLIIFWRKMSALRAFVCKCNLMKFVADLHLHSKYSRAVSQQMVLSKMAEWASFKGINVLGTGDFTHPFWFEQLKNELEEAGNGMYRLKAIGDKSVVSGQLSDVQQEVYFLLSCEVSSIYSQGGKGRRIHNLFFFPSMSAVEKFNNELLKRGANLRSDGRPIVGISSRDLVEIALGCDEHVLIIPAHIWTPWFSVFGSFSGFDSIEECFGDLAGNIYGIETGLSSDPAMNWRIGDLEGKTILSSSDAHSLAKMGREATVFEADEVSFDSIYKAITRGPVSSSPPASAQSSFTSQPSQSSKPEALRAVGSPSRTATPRIAFTIEFHPEEGKYHFTGHRDCNYSQGSEISKTKGTTCPVCSRPLTVGVMDRVEELAKNQVSSIKYQVSANGVRWVYPDGSGRPPYVSLVPLSEILAEALSLGADTKKVMDTYMLLVSQLGSEFNVLLKSDLKDIERFTSQKVAEGIEKVRNGNIVVEPGYDGKFGVVKIWQNSQELEEKKQAKDDNQEESQLNLFA